MKTRLGFVSNSSSSSFIIKKDILTDHQYNLLLNHKDFIDERYKDDEWEIDITSDKTYIIGRVDMDNFCMEDFCFLHDIPVKMFSDKWDAGYYVDKLNGNDEE
jgi:hypothetical protein